MDDVQQRDWRRGLIRPLSLLAVAEVGAVHGYDIASRLEELGLGVVPGGTLYPILRRFEDDGHLRSEWTAGEGGPGRKVYSVTDAGQRELSLFRSQWLDLVANITTLLQEEL